MTCYKQAFRTEGAARRGAVTLAKRNQRRHAQRHCAPYKCHSCGLWHLTSQKDRR